MNTFSHLNDAHLFVMVAGLMPRKGPHTGAAGRATLHLPLPFCMRPQRRQLSQGPTNPLQTCCTPAQEMGTPGVAARPLRRAVCRIVGAWVARLHADDRPAAYTALVARLGDEDAAVALAAAAALHSLVDDFGFEAPAFAAHVAPVVRVLSSILCNSSELDTQTQVVGVVRCGRARV